MKCRRQRQQDLIILSATPASPPPINVVDYEPVPAMPDTPASPDPEVVDIDSNKKVDPDNYYRVPTLWVSRRRRMKDQRQHRVRLPCSTTIGTIGIAIGQPDVRLIEVMKV